LDHTTSPVQQAVMALLRASMSSAGYGKARDVANERLSREIVAARPFSANGLYILLIRTAVKNTTVGMAKIRAPSLFELLGNRLSDGPDTDLFGRRANLYRFRSS
jgi:hypothetical protein